MNKNKLYKNLKSRLRDYYGYKIVGSDLHAPIIKSYKVILKTYLKIKNSYVGKIVTGDLNNPKINHIVQQTSGDLEIQVIGSKKITLKSKEMTLFIRCQTASLAGTTQVYSFKASKIEFKKNTFTATFIVSMKTMLNEDHIIINMLDVYLQLEKKYRIKCLKKPNSVFKFLNHDFIPYCTINQNFSFVIVRKESKQKVPDAPLSISFILFRIDYGGGVTKVTIDLANNLAERGYKINLIAVDLVSVSNKFPISEKVNFDYISINKHRPKGVIPSNIYSMIETVAPSFEKTLKEFFSYSSVDVIYLPIYGPALFTSILEALPTDTKKIIGDHSGRRYKVYDDLLKEKKDIKFDRVVKLTRNPHLFGNIDQVDAVHIVNPLIKNIYKQITNIPIIDIPNIVSMNTVERKPFFERNKVIILVGSLSSVKNFSTAIKVFSKLHLQYPDWTLEIYGKGTQKNLLLELISTYNLNKNVFIKGFTSNINTCFQNSMIHLSISHKESFGLTMVEAMNNHVPVVSTYTTIGARFLIENDVTGFMANNNSETEILKTLIRVVELTERENPLIQKVQTNAYLKSQDFKPNNIVDQWKTALELLNK